VAPLRGFGIDISKRELVRLLTTGHDSFHEEAREVLRAGLASAAWITVDDTGARHKANNGFCTQIGNAHFTAFATQQTRHRGLSSTAPFRARPISSGQAEEVETALGGGAGSGRSSEVSTRTTVIPLGPYSGTTR
jgi:hypothetical protein